MSLIYILVTAALCFTTVLSPAQIKRHVTWTVSSVRLGEQSLMVTMTAVVEKGWCIYLPDTNHEIPAFTRVDFVPSDQYMLDGTLNTENKSRQGEDPLFGIPSKRLEGEVVFTQKVNVKNKFAMIKGTLTVIPCSASECGKPEVLDFVLPVSLASMN